ncbi:MAG: RdgB/HAM1 family non-canonical purine NTP pyrophosphatase [Paludibacteraceae bacterium]|nr:RdgB/HAM1 family non-canonical purine NTP pyrophosphatase [Paludibacteraceae bacterium]
MKTVFASNNVHKLEEVRKILYPMEILGLRDIGFHHEIDEKGTTLEANSLLKAQVVWQWLVGQGLDTDISGVFADDTGLEIAALNGAPGVYSARWAGEPSDDGRNRQKALASLMGMQDRSARFRTVITWIDVDGAQQVEGIVEGRIATAESGAGGFGYDSLFIPQGHNTTFAALPATEKNRISHRARALCALRDTILTNND